VDAQSCTRERDPHLPDLFAPSSTNGSEPLGHKFVIAARPVCPEDFNPCGRTFDGVRALQRRCRSEVADAELAALRRDDELSPDFRLDAARRLGVEFLDVGVQLDQQGAQLAIALLQRGDGEVGVVAA